MKTFCLLLSVSIVCSIPLLFGYTFLPTDLLSLISPWNAGVEANAFQNHYYIDAIGEHFPWKMLFAQQVREGILPLWNPYNYLGVPFLALSTPQLFDPFNLFYLFLKPQLAFDVSLLVRIFFAGWFMSLLLRYYRVEGWSNAIGSLAYMLNGTFIANIHFGWMVGAFLWIPLVLLFLEKAFVSRPLRNIVFAALFLGMAILAGNIQITLHIFVLLAFWCSFHLVTVWRKEKNVWAGLRIPLYAAATFFLGLLVSAVCLVPTMELLSFGFQRSDSYFSAASAWFVNIGNNFLKLLFTLSFLVPHFFGHHSVFSPVLLTGLQWDHYVAGYAGLTPLVLACFAALFSPGENVRKYRFVGLMILGALFLAPFAAWLYFRSLIIWCFAVSLLAGFGAAQLGVANPHHLIKLKRFLGWFSIFLIGGLWLVQVFVSLFRGHLISFWGDVVRSKLIYGPFVSLKAFYLEKVARTFEYYSFSNTRLLITIGILFGFYLFLKFYITKKISLTWLLRGVFFLAAVDLIYFAVQYVPVVNLKKFPPYAVTPSIQFLKGDSEISRVMPLSAFNVDDPIFHHESNIPAGLQVVGHTGSINYPPSDRFFKALRQPSENLPFNPQLVNLANVKYFVTKSIALDTKQYPLVFQGEVNIYQNPKMLPRVFFPRLLSSGTDEFVYEKMSGPSFRAEQHLYLDHLPTIIPPKQGQGKLRAWITKYQSDTVMIDVALDNDQVLVLTDTYYPGWKAYVDGTETPIYKANAIFRAIEVPQGKHQVVFRFQPFSFWLGFWMSLSTLVFMVSVVLVPRR